MALQHESVEFVADNLFAGTQVQPVVADEVILAAGQGILQRGTVLSKTNGGEFVIVNSGADPVANTVDAILAETTDTGDSGAVPAPGYLTGEYNERALIFGGSDDADTHRDAARSNGIFFKDTVPA